ncbi:MAG TPA: flagellar export chaperone FliS [Campylobacterales bacterium]|nr:flagellar export chaperone FliS [Campylobacterales bacterium]
MTAKAYQAYNQNHTAVQTPEKLIEMLYEGLLRFASLAKRAIEEGDAEAKAKWINKSSDIFIELISSLSNDGTDMTAYLSGLYMHQIKTLNRANIKNSTNELDSIIHVVKVLLETWKEETTVEYEMA